MKYNKTEIVTADIVSLSFHDNSLLNSKWKKNLRQRRDFTLDL